MVWELIPVNYSDLSTIEYRAHLCRFELGNKATRPHVLGNPAGRIRGE